MIKVPHWQNLELRYEMLNQAWDELKQARTSGDTETERRAVMRYLQELQRVYEASQSAVSLL